jgi:hypothetical protein
MWLLRTVHPILLKIVANLAIRSATRLQTKTVVGMWLSFCCLCFCEGCLLPVSVSEHAHHRNPTAKLHPCKQ